MARTFRSSATMAADPLADSLGEDVNPSAYLVNLADCMLVLACGFLVSLVVAGSGIGEQLEMLSEGDLQEVEVETTQLEQDGSGTGYQNVGDVFFDPETGNYYIYERVEP